MICIPQVAPLTCTSGILGIQEDPNIIYKHFYWVRGPTLNPKPHLMYTLNMPGSGGRAEKAALRAASVTLSG